jgi:hypothetical protein
MKKKMIKNKTFTYPFGQTSKDAAVIQQWMKKENKMDPSCFIRLSLFGN